MTVTESGYTSEQILQMSKAGLQQCLDKMAQALPRLRRGEAPFQAVSL